MANEEARFEFPQSDRLESQMEGYLADNWEQVLSDMERLIAVPSFEELEKAAPGAPYGPGPRESLSVALDIAQGYGFEAHDVDGYIGYADANGTSGQQLGIIGHTDVVPAGPGWHFEPYALTRKDGYLLGRGTSDDKAPILLALHAAKFWMDEAARQGAMLPHDIRIMFGASEETTMSDVAYYRQRFKDPTFLFTPDADFPLGYGESGCCVGVLKSAPIEDGFIVEIAGGTAANAVPGLAHAVVRLPEGAAVPVSSDLRIAVSPAGDGLVKIEVHGKSAHASTPELGESAIAILVEFLLEKGLGNDGERTFLKLERDLLSVTDGSGVGIQAFDEHFGPLTAVGGVIGMEGNRITQTLDCRYPTTTTADAITQQMTKVAAQIGAEYVAKQDKIPFLMNPESPAVSALMTAYNDVTGQDAKPFVMKGGTYARLFSHAVSFGPQFPDEAKPAWVGGMHGPDEGVSEEGAKRAFRVYVRAIGNLLALESLA